MASVNPAEFVRQVRQEVSKVTWPSRKETGLSVMMVCLMVAVASVFFMLTDAIIAFAIEKILGF